jgi:predicted amidohydrolase
LKNLKIAIGQIPVVMGDKAHNLRTVFGAIEAAGQAQCDVIVLPECSLTGWLSPAAKTEAEPLPGKLTRSLARLARKHQLAIVVGLEERAGDKLYNTAVLIGRDGKLIARHRKINELDIGLQLYSKGDALNVVDFEGRKVALDICADSWVPHITESLYLMGAEIIFSPCAWAIEPGGEARNIQWISRIYRQRTRGKQLFIVSANGVGDVTQGPWRGKILQGNSLVFGPGGKKMLQGPTNQADLLVFHLLGCDLSARGKD